MYNINMLIALDIICVGMLLAVVYGVLFESQIKDIKSRFFAATCSFTIVAIITDIFAWYFYDGQPGHDGALKFFTVTSYILNMPIPIAFGYYELALIREKRKMTSWFAHIVAFLQCVVFCFLSVMAIKGSLVSVKDGLVTISPYMQLNLIACGISVFLLMIPPVLSVRSLGIHDTIALLAYGIVPLLGILIEYINPAYPLGYPTVAFSMLIVSIMLHSGQTERALYAVKEKDALVRAKSAFLATMSHEIRTPLNAIVGFSEFLRSPGGTESDQKEYINGIVKSSNVLLALINDVLDVSKLEVGMMEIRGGVCNIRKLFDEMTSIFKFKTEEKKLQLIMDSPKDIPTLALHEDRIRQILLNLVGNAVKFTSKGKIECIAAWDRENESSGTLTLAVADTGIGIHESKLTEIFDPFKQDGGVRGGKVYEGTGLGLAICKRIAEAAGGTIQVESKPDKGSRFTVVIPHVTIVHESKQEYVNDINRVSVSSPIDPASLRVIAVDDVKMNLMVIARHIELAGVPRKNIDTFLNAEDALSALRGMTKVTADSELGKLIIFTDVWMPKMNGTEFAQEIRANNLLKNIPIIAVTADADSSKSFDTSVFDYILTKPLTGEKLKEGFGAISNRRFI